jgi:hypothetical protein
MAQIKLRIELNKGRTGAPLDKLGDIARQMERFLRSLAADLKLEIRPSEWLAVNFKNGSVSWDSALQEEVAESDVRRFNNCIEFITDYDPETEGTNGLISDLTLLEYGRIGERIDPDEIIGVGIYPSNGQRRLRWRRIEYRKAGRIRRAIEAPIYSYGSVQGEMHSLIKGVARPYFQLREFASNQLVRCFYESDLYADVHRALEHRNAVVHATGQMRLDRARRAVEDMQVERLDRVEPLTDEEFLSLFGAAPDLTGELSTDEYIAHIRGDG